MSDKKVLVVDDEENIRILFKRSLAMVGIRDIEEAATGREALEKIKQDSSIRVVFSDLRMPEMDGMELLENINKLENPPTVILFTAYGDEDTLIEAAQKNAYDFLSKPLSTDQIQKSAMRALEREELLEKNKQLSSHTSHPYSFDDIVAKSKKMQEIFEIVRKIAPYKTTVLIEGESGTGKELIARAIHNISPRRNKKFIPVNCGAIPETLLESEFFGYTRGAFTGADSDKKGLFEEADGGTLFLDEVAELPQQLQVKLLRVLQEGEIRRIGDVKPIKVDVRIIAATNKDMEKEVEEGRFREDLYYRLNVVNIKIPPLRERIEDIPALVSHFIDKYNQLHGKVVRKVSPEVMKILLNYNWKGNVRELENVIERAVLLSNSDTITTEHIPEYLLSEDVKAGDSIDLKDELDIKKICRKLEIQLIKKALQQTGGNKTQAARLLGISTRALLYKLKDYEIET